MTAPACKARKQRHPRCGTTNSAGNIYSTLCLNFKVITVSFKMLPRFQYAVLGPDSVAATLTVTVTESLSDSVRSQHLLLFTLMGGGLGLRRGTTETCKVCGEVECALWLVKCDVQAALPARRVAGGPWAMRVGRMRSCRRVC
jgi:hypothetical protein